MALPGLLDDGYEPDLFVRHASATGTEIVEDMLFEVIDGLALKADYCRFEMVDCPLKGHQLIAEGFHGCAPIR